MNGLSPPSARQVLVALPSRCRFALLVLTGALGWACGAPVVHSRFISEFGCPRDQTRVSSLGGNAYLAVGCGRRASYVCINDTCALDNVERDARAVVSSNRRTQVSRSNADSALFVLEDDDVLTLSFSTGHPDRITAIVAPASSQSCTELRIRSDRVTQLRFESTATLGFAIDRAELVGWTVDRMATVHLCGRAIRLDNAETLDLVAFRDAVSSMSGGSAPTPTALPAPASQEDHASLRGWLDSQRDVVLGCTGSDLAIVTIEPAETAARIALRPPFAGTAEEECVRSALGAPPSVPSGRVIHALRAAP